MKYADTYYDKLRYTGETLKETKLRLLAKRKSVKIKRKLKVENYKLSKNKNE